MVFLAQILISRWIFWLGVSEIAKPQALYYLCPSAFGCMVLLVYVTSTTIPTTGPTGSEGAVLSETS